MSRGIEPRVNVVESKMTYIFRDFVTMNPPIFLYSMVGEDHQKFLDRLYKEWSSIGVTYTDKAKLVSYELEEVYTQWKDNRQVEWGPIELEEFKEAFLGKYFSRERREVRLQKFINLKYGNMNVEKYYLK